MTSLALTPENYNAKNVPFNIVANGFVEPTSFSEIAGFGHCYLCGPRGCGKTTLLKMLTGKALMAVPEKSPASRWKNIISYSSIFVPADGLWNSQTNEKNSIAAFAAQILRKFVVEMKYRASETDEYSHPVHLPVTLDEAEQLEISKYCAEAWGFHNIAPGFNGLINALDNYSLNITQDSTLSTKDPLQLLLVGIRAFNTIVDEPDRRWALLVDEVEIAPQVILETLSSFVRSGAQELILKLSMSPFDRYGDTFKKTGRPFSGNDFREIDLSSFSDKDLRKFTSGIWDSLLNENDMEGTDELRVVLGETQWRRAYEKNYTAYKEKTKELLSDAKENDPTFKDWLKRKEIDINKLSKYSYNEISATIRKVRPILFFRQAFMKEAGAKRTRRELPELYSGYDAVVTMLEGNPRWIVTAFYEFLKKYREVGEVDPGFQYNVLLEIAKNFEALLEVTPDQTGENDVGILDIANAVSDCYHSDLIGTFTADPKSSFVIDNEAVSVYKIPLVRGLYAGAFMIAKSSSKLKIGDSLSGQRLRLSYLLAIRTDQEFMTRQTGKSKQLSKILSKEIPIEKEQSLYEIPY